MQTTMPPPSPSTVDPTAVTGRRIGAAVIDWLPMPVILVATYANATTRFDSGSEIRAELDCDRVNELTDDLCIAVNDEAWVTDAGDMGLAVLAVVAYFFFFLGLLPGVSGWSLGKLVTRLRVVKQDTFEPAGIGAGLLRWSLWVVDAVPYCVPLVGFITMLASKGHRRVGDMAASTLVVDRDAVGRPVAIPGLTDVAAPSAPLPTTAPPVPPPTAPPVASPVPPPTAPPVAAPPVFPPIPDETPAPTFPPPADDTADAPPTGEPVVDVPPPAAEAPPLGPGFVPPGSEETTAMPVVGGDEPTTAMSRADLPVPEAAEPPVAAESTDDTPASPPRPGIDAPQWDRARNTYIQWDPELEAWMEWDEANGRWIPIST